MWMGTKHKKQTLSGLDIFQGLGSLMKGAGRIPCPLTWRDKKTNSWKSEIRFRKDVCFCFLVVAAPKRVSFRSDKDAAFARFAAGNLVHVVHQHERDFSVAHHTLRLV